MAQRVGEWGSKMKWQRARILRSIASPEAIGREVWTRLERPELRGGTALVSRVSCTIAPTLRLNLLAINGFGNEVMVIADTEMLELLARDESDFAEDVPLIPWKQFLAECRGAS